VQILLGVWLAVGGAVAALAGLSGLWRVRRLRRDGHTAWAATIPAPVPVGGDGSPSRPLLRYTLADGRVVERIAPAAARRHPGEQGHKVLIWYDPDDPDDVLVYGRWGRVSDRAFLAVGVVCVLAGVVIATA
jgi:hypothetical protein